MPQVPTLPPRQGIPSILLPQRHMRMPQEDVMSGPIKPCARCGIKRQARANAVTCRDCKDVLTPTEYALWVSKDANERIWFHERQIEMLRRLA